MVTIADKIREWARTKLFNQTDLTRNTEAYNRVRAAVEDLASQGWTQAPAPGESGKTTKQGSEPQG